MAATVASEHEVKVEAWAGFRLPELSGLGEGVLAVPRPQKVLDATYYDTADLRLARWGITVRFRTGDGDGAGAEGAWTVKLPDKATSGQALARREVTLVAPHRVVPDEVAGLVRAYVRSALLRPVVRLVTRRRPLELRGGDERRLVEVSDDEVSVMEGRHLALRFREVEVEVEAGTDAALLAAVVERLHEAGAGPAGGAPKLVRALGPRATAPPDVVVPGVGPDASMAEVVRAAVAAGTARLLAHDPGVRLGEDPEDVHQARVAVRRLRSDLRTFRGVVDAEALGTLGDELRWVGAELGGVRDADVLLERLRGQATELADPDAGALAALLHRLEASREEHRARLLAALDSDRYLALLDALVAAAAEPPCLAKADRRAAKLLPRVVGKTFARLEAAVDALDDDPDLEALHQVRIRAKRARYASEAAAPVIGKPARRLATALARLQGVLGDVNDAVVAEAWLRPVAQAASAAEALLAGELTGRQWVEIDQGRRQWRAAWRDASASSLRSWLR